MSSRTQKSKALSFEQATARLEEIVECIDSPATGLEEMISLVDEGLKLIRSSRDLLQKAELKIRQLEVSQTATAATPEAPQQNDEFTLM